MGEVGSFLLGPFFLHQWSCPMLTVSLERMHFYVCFTDLQALSTNYTVNGLYRECIAGYLREEKHESRIDLPALKRLISAMSNIYFKTRVSDYNGIVQLCALTLLLGSIFSTSRYSNHFKTPPNVPFCCKQQFDSLTCLSCYCPWMRLSHCSSLVLALMCACGLVQSEEAHIPKASIYK